MAGIHEKGRMTHVFYVITVALNIMLLSNRSIRNIFVLLCGMTCLVSLGEAVDTYRAAVYGHNATFIKDRTKMVTRTEALDVMMKNIDVYRHQAVIAAKMDAKIIVFPEYGLYGVGWTRATIEPYLEYIAPVIKPNWNPCTRPNNQTHTEVQQALSCLARLANIYVVANMGTRQPCPKADRSCPPDGYYQHSANVVYAPNGDFIARYFKYHLYSDEVQWDKPASVDITTFTTPFGRFGTMTSNDIVFHDPIIRLVKDMNITNIAYPTSWRNDLPLYSAIEFHSAFSEAMLINLLSANLQMPKLGYYGSGLYWPTGTSINASYTNDADPKSGGELVVETMTPFIVQENTVMSRHYNDDVKSQHEADNKDMLRHDYKDDVISKHDADQTYMLRQSTDVNYDSDRTTNITINHDVYTAILKRGVSYSDVNVCQNTLCCSADYEGQFPKELYAFGVFDGMHTEGANYYLQACVFIKCAGDTAESCGKPVTTSSSYMSKMSFVGNFSSPFVFPEVLTDQGGGGPGLVTSIWYYQESVIIDAGLYGGPLSISMLSRDYSRDP